MFKSFNMFKVSITYFSILMEDQLEKLCFIWNPLPSIVYDVFSLINLNVQSMIVNCTKGQNKLFD